jgi:hypothetical protein
VLLVEGHGVDGGRARRRDRAAPVGEALATADPNLRQVHLLHAELLDDLRERGFAVGPGDVGENVLVRGLDLLAAAHRARACTSARPPSCG